MQSRLQGHRSQGQILLSRIAWPFGDQVEAWIGCGSMFMDAEYSPLSPHKFIGVAPGLPSPVSRPEWPIVAGVSQHQ